MGNKQKLNSLAYSVENLEHIFECRGYLGDTDARTLVMSLSITELIHMVEGAQTNIVNMRSILDDQKEGGR